jgi:hypothetical protein
MTLAIILFAMVMLGIVLFGYAMNINKRSVDKEDALKSGGEVRRGEVGK